MTTFEFVSVLMSIVVEVLDSFLKGAHSVLTELGPAWFLINGASAGLGIAALRVSDRRFHRAFAILVLLAYATWTLSTFRAI